MVSDLGSYRRYCAVINLFLFRDRHMGHFYSSMLAEKLKLSFTLDLRGLQQKAPTVEPGKRYNMRRA